MERGNLYFASLRAALLASLFVYAGARIARSGAESKVREHNCLVEQAEDAARLSDAYATNAVVRRVKTDDGKHHYDWDTVKLLVYKAADSEFGPGNYDLKMEQTRPCRAHGGPARIYYTLKRKGE